MSNQLRALLIAFTLLVSLSVFAQEDSVTPACTDTDRSTVADVTLQFVSDFVAVEISDIDTLDALQVRWWSELQPALPNCTQAHEAAQFMGRLIDEQLLATSLVAAGRDDLATYHSEQTIIVIGETQNMLARLGLVPEAETEATQERPATLYYVNSNGAVNLRSCGSTDCGIVATASRGEELRVVDDTGDWYEVELDDGSSAYIAAFLASSNPPAAQPVQPPPTAVPAQPEQAQPPPAQEQPTAVPPPPTPIPPAVSEPVSPPPAPQFTCNCSKTCGAMASCEEAYFQLNTCGCGQRDGDNDGVPCESICPGG